MFNFEDRVSHFPDDTLKPTDDSLSVIDTTGILDSLKLTQATDTVKIDSLKLDSTARQQYFKYVRRDRPYMRFYEPKGSKFFVEPTNKKREIKIDSTGKYVEVSETVSGQKTKLPLKIPIDEYLNVALRSKEQKLWEELNDKYELKSGKKDLTGLIRDITDFEIPLPSVGILSIFGAPKIKLNIGGAVDIHGAWRNETTEGITASGLGNTRNEPDFRQQVQINVNGTIGDKLQITADWNTERTFEYENQLKIKYTGYEDEIVQSVEAGNVSLQTSGLVGGSEALFGVKAQFKMGPLNLTMLASQKKGEVKEKTVSGGSTTSTFTKRAYDYSTNHFFLDSVYADTSADLNIFNKYYGSATPITIQKYYVKDIEVWKSINQTLNNPNERLVNAYITLPPIARNQTYPDNLRSDGIEEVQGRIAKGRFLRLTKDKDYILNPYTGVLTFKTNILETDIIAVSYTIDNDLPGFEDDQFFGEFLNPSDTSTTKRLILKLVKPKNLQPSDRTAWRLMLKNIYSIGGRDIKKEGFQFDLKYEVEGQEPQSVVGTTRLLSAFGFDEVDVNGSPPGDGIFDYTAGRNIIPETGEIIFPVLEPFGRNIPQSIPNADSLRYLDVYDTSTVGAKNNRIKDKFILSGTYTGSVTASYQLGFNVVENSVKVSLNGRDLTPGVDYFVDYNIGTLTIRNEAALVPGANLRISYEENDLFQIASKTLFGLRGVFDLSKRTTIGFSALTLTEQTLSDKVRIGEEPLSNSIYGVDFSTSADMPFLTRALDKVFSTKEMSTFNLRGEFAYMSPDPNTKKSTIQSDGGKSIAYIDDFEGTKRIIPVGIGYTAWKDLSVPRLFDDRIDTLRALDRMNYKGKSWWFSVLPSDVDVRDIWPEKRVAKGDEAVSVLDYVYQPDTAGTYNYNPNLSDRKLAWGGMMKMLSTTASNLIDENIEFIEFWMNIDQAPSNAKLYIDLGKISEDVIPNGRLDTEDKNRNDLVDVGEDVGLDGLSDDAERAFVGNSDPDPSRDNFVYRGGIGATADDYFNINGTEGNAALTDAGRIPDTEDLNRNGSVDEVNSYFRYEIPLDTNRLVNPYLAGGNNDKGWYLYRIPLKDFTKEIGGASFSVVEMIRLFVTGVDQRVHFRLTEFNLVGSQWYKVLPNDSVLSVSVVNIEDNPDYSSPSGVQRERDRSRPDQEIFRNEQSLNLILKELRQGEKREAVKNLLRPLDVFNYKEMKLFIHGDINPDWNSISYFESITNHATDVYFRFGTDSNNYYEFRKPLQPDWQEITIPFKDLTAIKQTRDSANAVFKLPVTDQPGSYYLIKGNPTLTQVKFLSVGVQNRYDEIPPPNGTGITSGEVWVNELRVIGADDTPGWAYSASTSVKFADIMTLNFNIAETDPYFHRLAERFGSRTEARNWGFSADIDLLKLLPVNSQGSNLRLNYSRTESVGKPLYLPSTDIRISEAQDQMKQKLESQNTLSQEEIDKTVNQLASDAQTVNISDSYTLSNIKIKIPSNHWLIRDTFNSMTFGFTYNKTFSRNPSTLANMGWVWNGNMNYAVNLSPDYSFYPANIPYVGDFITWFTDYKNLKIYYAPQSFSYNMTAKRNRNENITRPTLTTTSDSRVSRDFSTTRGFSFNWKITEGGFFNVSTSYSFDAVSTLAYLELDQTGFERPESRIWKDVLTKDFFGRDYNFNQTFDVKTSPKLPSIWNIGKNFTISLGYNVRYSWQNNFQQEDLGRSAGYNNRINGSLTVRWKALMEPLFGETTTDQKSQVQQPARDPRNRAGLDGGEVKKDVTDSTGAVITDVPADTVAAKPSSLTRAFSFFKMVFKYAIVDYESISFGVSNDNSLSASGVRGVGTGFNNFWGYLYRPDMGPNRAFMLGLSNDVGPRALKGNLSDNFSQRNSIDLKTARPLWEGARIDVNWKVGWSMNKSKSIVTDSLGNMNVTNITSTGSLNRSFLTIPPVFFLSVFKSGIKEVAAKYNPKAPDPAENLSQAFVSGFETMPVLSKFGFMQEFMNYIPRPNWRITWDGIEKFTFFQNYTKRVSLDHSYSSEYTEGWKLNPDGTQVTQSQKISYGFQPLLGMNITFNTLWEGNLTGSVKYSTRNSYDLSVTTKNVTEGFSRDVGISVNYSKSGFEVPLFGISLKNDIEFSFSYTNTKNSTVIFDMNKFDENGTPQDGTTRTSLEPRVKYIISSRVSLSIFYKRSTTEPEGAARIPPTTINEAGLDVRISIQP
ncbi:MAG: cell surface protein SprA [Ignavibacteriaceae bacterium]|nr:cell surface protein SprA [Ignavibacteriaceae bacterium]